MLTVKRFASFVEAQSVWSLLEEKTDHYPFQELWYQQVFANHFCKESDVFLLAVYHNDQPLAVGGFEKINNACLFLGMKQVLNGQDLTDYGDILIHPDILHYSVEDIWQVLINYCKNNGISSLQLDFVREDSKTFHLFQKKQRTTEAITLTHQEVAPYIIPPANWDAYLEQLSRTERHELKRKIRRFESLEAFKTCSDETIHDDFEDFIRLHRLSDPNKEQFMSEEMKSFFWDIMTAKKRQYEMHFCFLTLENKKVAAVLSFYGLQKALLYNSGYDPSYAHFSMGLILHAYLIKKSIEKKYKVHDYLRGSERYKYDLGAKNMQLYKITVPLT